MHQDILTEGDRKVLCDFLFRNAADETLLRVVEETKDHHQYVRSSFDSLRKFIGVSKFTADPTPIPAKAPEKEEPVRPPNLIGKERPNTEPPGQAANRIRSATQTTIERHLKDGPASADAINRVLNGVLSNTQSGLKLLWTRKVIGFSNGEYWLL